MEKEGEARMVLDDKYNCCSYCKHLTTNVDYYGYKSDRNPPTYFCLAKDTEGVSFREKRGKTMSTSETLKIRLFCKGYECKLKPLGLLVERINKND